VLGADLREEDLWLTLPFLGPTSGLPVTRARTVDSVSILGAARAAPARTFLRARRSGELCQTPLRRSEFTVTRKNGFGCFQSLGVPNFSCAS
jgi:hypothetical protein